MTLSTRYGQFETGDMRFQLSIANETRINLILWYLVCIWISGLNLALGSGDKTILSNETSLDSMGYSFSNFEPLSTMDLREYMTELLKKNPSLRDCPAPVLPITRDQCSQTQCRDHEDCQDQGFLCCFNGCVFTCQHKIPPPPVIDWPEEPPGISTFPTYPDSFRNVTTFSSPEVKTCSTSPTSPPSMSLDCPAGYVCRIEHVEDPLAGVPNLGICVPVVNGEKLESKDSGDTYLEKFGKETVFLPGGCALSKEKYDQLQEFQKRPYIVGCICTGGVVECNISRNGSDLHLKTRTKNVFHNVLKTRKRTKE
ncbi:uncharacterized protein LOC106458700 [Limulus polyphemus]|uniref:Uncharacterized protein LOC106458700 n=1 Tax=Limulus polyphemus TaxID=6850 RepID=A0ABM1B2W9_LIMPO|nr:uncharacterized protein LOC106458700 [Limulus polyphemus]